MNGGSGDTAALPRAEAVLAATIPDAGRALPDPPRAQAYGGGPAAALAADPAPGLAHYGRFEDVLSLIRAQRDVKLLVEVEGFVRLVRYAPGRIEFEQAPGAPPDLAQRLGQRLQTWTGLRWGLSVVSAGGAPSVAEQRDAGRAALEAEARAHPLVQAVLAAFPSARISEIRTAEALRREAAEAALPEVESEWDPFEDG